MMKVGDLVRRGYDQFLPPNDPDRWGIGVIVSVGPRYWIEACFPCGGFHVEGSHLRFSLLPVKKSEKNGTSTT